MTLAFAMCRLQSLAGPPGLPPGMHGGMSLPTFIQQSRPPGPYGLSAVPLPPRSGEVLTLDGDSPPRHLPNLNIEVAGGLHTVRRPFRHCKLLATPCILVSDNTMLSCSIFAVMLLHQLCASARCLWLDSIKQPVGCLDLSGITRPHRNHLV